MREYRNHTMANPGGFGVPMGTTAAMRSDVGGYLMLAGAVGFLGGGYWGYTHWAPMLYYTKPLAKLLVALSPASIFALDATVIAGVAMGVGHNSMLVDKMSPKSNGQYPSAVEVAIALVIVSGLALGLQWGINYAEYHWLGIHNDYWRFFLPTIVSWVLALL